VKPRPGDIAPDFSGLTTDGSRVRLQDYRGRKLVLYFYPMDDTPGCTAQACSLRDRYAEIEAKGAAVLGVSAQGVESHDRFTRKHKLSFPLLADTGRAAARAYGAIGGGLGGTLRGVLGMAERVTFVIDEQGRIAHVIDNVNTKDHAGQVLALL